MAFAEEDYVMVSGIQHFLFCKRRFALIHIEGLWEENRYTAEGRNLHTRVDSSIAEKRKDVIISTTLRILNRELGITGVMDMCEFHRVECEHDAKGARIATTLPNREGLWMPFPVEYKHGNRVTNMDYSAQLCAQALCLEEMFKVTIPSGALFFGSTRQRQDVEFSEVLRNQTRETIAAMHEVSSAGGAPPAVYKKACDNCSLVDMCRPKTFGKSAKSYFARCVEEALK